jgi:hypothetical protein
MNKKTPCLFPNSAIKTTNFQCIECNKCFTTNQTLKNHILNTCPIIQNKKNTPDHKIQILTNMVNELKLTISNIISQKSETIYIPKIIEDSDIITGNIYLIQPEELLQTNRYKIGCSTKNDLSRVNSYKKKSRYLYIAECIYPFALEANIKNVFNNKYKLIAGKEYFEGNEKDIVNDFVKIVNDYNNKIYCTEIHTEILDNTIKDNIGQNII